MRRTNKQDKTVKAVRITDPYIVQLITSEQKQSGEATATKTAARLITEFVTLKKAQAAHAEAVA